ncbi:FAD dependent oxidoreductase [Hypoxylon sp. NC1633]|nr:FAD dependent oxidoreductase [Hypoxylon sp. NC1633]
MSLPYPVPNATVPYWRTELHKLDSHRSTMWLPQKQDIVIIGAGFAGTALAHYLLKDNPSKPSITILEAREACSGATGRNGGQLRPDLFVGCAARMQEHGLETANEVARFEVANAQAIVSLVEEEKIACDLRAVTTADMFVDADEAAKVKRLWDAMSKLDCPSLKDVTYHGPDEAGRVTGIRGAKVAFSYPSYTLWPYKLVMHLLAGVVEQGGVNLQTHTPVHTVSEAADSEGYWVLSTARGTMRAKRVIFATNAYLSSLLPEYDDAVYANRSTVCRIVPPAFLPEVPLRSAGLALKSPDTMDSYYGLRPDSSFIVGGAKSAFWYQNREEWYRNFDDSTQIKGTVSYFKDWAARTFEGWEETPGQLDRVWTGIMGYTADDAPHIGHVPSKPGLYVCAGFNGHGMPNVLLCAKGLAEMVKNGSAFSETGLPASYETSAERLQKSSASTDVSNTGRVRVDVYLKY